MKDCGIESIDAKKNRIAENVRSITEDFNDNNLVRIKNRALSVKKELFNFRMQLAYNRATESLESDFDWTSIFEKFDTELSTIINS
ncbi:MAG: hypothetical protein AAF960_22050 [Bacteroidota bacterium]